MGIMKWMARKGAVGETARWAAKGYHAQIREYPDCTHFDLLMNLIETRYFSATDTPLKMKMMDLITTDPENRLLEAKFFPGLHRLVVCLLTLEAGFEDNSLENQKIFKDTIREELLKNKVPKSIVDNSNILISNDKGDNNNSQFAEQSSNSAEAKSVKNVTMGEIKNTKKITSQLDLVRAITVKLVVAHGLVEREHCKLAEESIIQAMALLTVLKNHIEYVNNNYTEHQIPKNAISYDFDSIGASIKKQLDEFIPEWERPK